MFFELEEKKHSVCLSIPSGGQDLLYGLYSRWRVSWCQPEQLFTLRFSFIRPLNLIMFQSAGERLNAIISFVLSRVKRYLGFRRHKVSGFELIAVEFGMTTIVILGGSLVFCEQEKWTYFEAIYYSFVTFWTIGKRSFSRQENFPRSMFDLGFGDFVPLANVQRSGRSLYSRWGYFIFTISFILFGLAIMASSLNLLVLRLAQFNSEHGTGGISALLGRNEEDLIAAAIAHHRASIHIQQHNRICSNSTSLIPQQKLSQSYLPVRTYSWCSASSSSTSASTSKFDVTRNSHERTSCSAFPLFGTQKRKRRHWHLRRSPQNIKHLLYFDHLLENHKLTSLKKSAMPSHHQENHHGNHQTGTMNSSRLQRISIWAKCAHDGSDSWRLPVSIRESNGFYIGSLTSVSVCVCVCVCVCLHVSQDRCALLLFVSVSLFDSWHMLMIDLLVDGYNTMDFQTCQKTIFYGYVPSFLLPTEVFPQ